ncbi:hypothetical protein MTBLM1_90009 [Rhodospirillaceae bacterium LM-1]|nr:hypothetical protein MTBLM1_90009 [Rhodospirillaceae bacterium LM-1]
MADVIFRVDLTLVILTRKSLRFAIGEPLFP